jgi:hypothetical protein
LDNIQIISTALSDQISSGQIVVETSRPGAGRLILNSAQDKSRSDVAIQTGEGFLRDNPKLRPDFIKIDVEGHEPEVISGLVEILSTYKPVLSIEVFGNLWTEGRRAVWVNTLERLFTIYKSGILISDSKSIELHEWNQKFLTGGMQTIVFGSNQQESIL